MTIEVPQLHWNVQAAGQAHVVKADIILPDSQVLQLHLLVDLSDRATLLQMKVQALRQAQDHIQHILQSMAPAAEKPPSGA